MSDRENVVSKLDKLRLFADTEIHPIVSPDNWDVYSKLCDLIDLTKDDVLSLLKEQENRIKDLEEKLRIDISLKERNDNFDLYDTPIFGFHD